MPEVPAHNPTRDAMRAAVAHHRAGRLAEAEAIYRGVLADSPEHADAWNLLGVCLHQRGQTAHGAGMIERALYLDPTAAEYHHNLATALHSAGDVGAAIAGYRRALELKPDYLDASTALQTALRQKADLAAAAPAAAASIEAPWPAPGGKALGVLLRCEGDHFDSIQAVKSLTQDVADVRRCDIHVVAGGASPAIIAALRSSYDAGRLTTLIESVEPLDAAEALRLALEAVRTPYLLTLARDARAKAGWSAAWVEWIERHHPFDRAEGPGGVALVRAEGLHAGGRPSAGVLNLPDAALAALGFDP